MVVETALLATLVTIGLLFELVCCDRHAMGKIHAIAQIRVVAFIMSSVVVKRWIVTPVAFRE